MLREGGARLSLSCQGRATRVVNVIVLIIIIHKHAGGDRREQVSIDRPIAIEEVLGWNTMPACLRVLFFPGQEK